MHKKRKSAVGIFSSIIPAKPLPKPAPLVQMAPFGKRNLPTVVPNDIVEAVNFWLDYGFLVLPAEISNGIKKPLVKFADQRHLMTADLSRYLFNQRKDADALMVMTDNNLLLLDADTPESTKALYALEARFNLTPKLVVKTRNGEHHYFLLGAGVKAVSRGFNGKLAPSKIDIRTGKSLAILPPSKRDGEIAYTVINKQANNINELSVVTQAFVNAVFAHNGDVVPESKNTELISASKWDGSESELKETEELLSYIDPNLGYEDWLNVLFGITSKYGQTEQAITLIDNWSSKGESYNGLDSIVYKISTINPNGLITYATVCDYAKQDGADLSEISKKHNDPIMLYASFDDAVNRLRTERMDKVAFEAAIKHLSQAHSLDANIWIPQFKLLTGMTLGDIRSEIKNTLKVEPLTQGQISQKYINQLNNPAPVGAYGQLWIYNHSEGVWDRKELSTIGVEVSKIFEKEPLCRKGNDYKSIAGHTYDIVADEYFFKNSPKGVYTDKGFHCVQGKKIYLLPPSPLHRARFRLSISPDEKCPTPEFLNMLKDGFGDSYDDQIRQLKQFFGLALFGIQSDQQVACLLIGKGGSGKSTVFKIIQHLVPEEVVSQVSPTEMDSDYKKAALAGKLINLVPEINKDKPIPSAEFKSIVGGDTINAREPYGKVFSFTPEAACWFNGNFYPTTRDHSDGFYRRWAIFQFKHGKSESERDPNLLKRIIDNELSGILAWAFNGLGDYFINGLQLSPAHYSGLAEWRRDSNSVLSWLHDDSNINIRVTRSDKSPLKATYAYDLYKVWCVGSNRKSFNRKLFYSYMEEAGYNKRGYQGTDSFAGLFYQPSVFINT